MRPEQPPAFDADLNDVAGIVQDDLYVGAVWFRRGRGQKTMNRTAIRWMPVRFRPDDFVFASAEMPLEMPASSFIRFICCGHDCLLLSPENQWGWLMGTAALGGRSEMRLWLGGLVRAHKAFFGLECDFLDAHNLCLVCTDHDDLGHVPANEIGSHLIWRRAVSQRTGPTHYVDR
jgi:hypothetical protein